MLYGGGNTEHIKYISFSCRSVHKRGSKTIGWNSTLSELDDEKERTKKVHIPGLKHPKHNNFSFQHRWTVQNIREIF